jgi:hypothetical protein
MEKKQNGKKKLTYNIINIFRGNKRSQSSYYWKCRFRKINPTRGTNEMRSR